MVKISVEVHDEAARFDARVQAESIRRAVSLARGRYPGADVGVKLRIDAEDFFAEHSAARTGTASFDRPHGMAA